MTETQTIKDRLNLLIKALGVRVSHFEQKCGISNGYVANIRASISQSTLQKIIKAYPQVNAGWLMTGEGKMLKEEECADKEQEQSNSDGSQQANGSHITQRIGDSSSVDKALNVANKAIDSFDTAMTMMKDSLAEIRDTRLSLIEEMRAQRETLTASLTSRDVQFNEMLTIIKSFTAR